MARRTLSVDDPWATSGSTEETPIGKVAGNPGLGRWNAWIVEQGSIWIDFENQVYLINQMSSRYAFNVLRFLFVHHKDDLGDPYQNPLCAALIARLKDEELKQVFVPLKALR